MKRYHFAGAAVLMLTVMAPCPAPACGFIADVANAITLRQEVATAKLVVYGTLVNPRETPNGAGSTDLIVCSVLKSHPILDGKSVLTLPRYLPVKDSKNPPHWLVFVDVFKGEMDPYRGVVTGPAIIGYLKGLVALDGSDRTRVVRYCFDFLDHPDRDVAADALLEIMKTTDKELDAAARKLPAAKLRAWLKDPKTPADRLRLYGFLLGSCGGDDDAALLRALLERQVGDTRPSLFDGVLTGYVLLRPKEGWAYVRELMGKSDNDFTVRYSGLRAARFFYNTRPDVIGQADVLGAVRLALSQPDMADLAVEYLRQSRRWDLTDRILPLYGKPSHAIPIVRWAVLRYALQCPRPEAAAFVAGVRKADAQLVADAEELLKLEAAR